MKLRYNFFLFISIFALICSDIKSNTKDRSEQKTSTSKPISNKPVYRQKRFAQRPKKITRFFKPIKYTRSGIQCWLKHTFNDYAYGQRFLPFNLSHLEQFLSYADENEQPRLYSQSVLRLFTQKLKTSPYINAYALSESLDPIYQSLQPKCNIEKEKRKQKQALKKCIYSYLLKEFATLKTNPDEALDVLSENILNTLDDENLDIPIFELQSALYIFLEVALSKIIWSINDLNEVWPNIKQLAYDLEIYHESNLISQENLDALFWSLLSKFAYFIEINTPELPQEFFKSIVNEIDHSHNHLWTLPEQEAFITTKYDYLRKLLVSASIANKAYVSGLIVPN